MAIIEIFGCDERRLKSFEEACSVDQEGVRNQTNGKNNQTKYCVGWFVQSRKSRHICKYKQNH
jgi:hypothetical protein